MFRTRCSSWGSPAIYAAILLAFLLPFATVSCGGEEVTFTGAQLALAQVPAADVESGQETLSGDIQDESGFWALLALVAAIVGPVSPVGAEAESPRGSG